MVIDLFKMHNVEKIEAEKTLICKLKCEKYTQFLFGVYGYARIYTAGIYNIALYKVDYLDCFDPRILKLTASKYGSELLVSCYSILGDSARLIVYSDGCGEKYILDLASAVSCDVASRGLHLKELTVTVL